MWDEEDWLSGGRELEMGDWDDLHGTAPGCVDDGGRDWWLDPAALDPAA